MPSRKPLWPLLAVAMLSLTACGTPGGSSPSACPEIVEYPPEVSQRLADEIEQLPADSIIPMIVEDYIRERDMLRACR